MSSLYVKNKYYISNYTSLIYHFYCTILVDILQGLVGRGIIEGVYEYTKKLQGAIKLLGAVTIYVIMRLNTGGEGDRMSTSTNQGQPPRFFAMADAKRIPVTHPEYASQIQTYFHDLFPQRQWMVFTDPIGSPLPITVEMLYPTVEEPFYLLHTMGMSAAPLHYPSELASNQENYCELSLILPSDWPFRNAAAPSLMDPAAWPIWLLMELGRFPHVHQIWISYGFILPNSENYCPFSSMTKMSGVVIVQFEGELGNVRMNDGTEIEFLMPIPAYKEELELCDTIGIDALIDDILETNDGSFLLNMSRKNIVPLYGKKNGRGGFHHLDYE
jgi:hypothetical protein